jgi:hypothetical protein
MIIKMSVLACENTIRRELILPDYGKSHHIEKANSWNPEIGLNWVISGFGKK